MAAAVLDPGSRLSASPEDDSYWECIPARSSLILEPRPIGLGQFLVIDETRYIALELLALALLDINLGFEKIGLEIELVLLASHRRQPIVSRRIGMSSDNEVLRR